MAPPPPSTDNGTRQAAQDVLRWLNTKANRNYRMTDRSGHPTANLVLIESRIKSGITPGQLRAIVTHKVAKWGGDPKMQDYLRPETLFGKTKCEQYVGELPALEDPDGMP